MIIRSHRQLLLSSFSRPVFCRVNMAAAMSSHYPYIVFVLLTLNAVHDVRAQYGTTPGIEKIFIDRCDAFQKQNPVPFQNNPKNCTVLWKLFLNSFANKDPCSIAESNYDDFFLAANYTAAIKDQAIFWSFVSPFVYNYTDSVKGRYTTVLDLMTGYITNNLNWCWNTSKKDLDYDNCPYYKDCPNENEAVRSFWKVNSRTFARLAAGNVTAMLNGSTDGAFLNRSLFYTVEVPTMSNPSIVRMKVILVHNPGGPIREYCYNGTLVELQNYVMSKSIEIECTEDPPDVRQLQCRLYPQYAEHCTQQSSSPASTVPSIVAYQVIATLVLWVVKFG